MKRIDIQDNTAKRHVVDSMLQIQDTSDAGDPRKAAVSVISHSEDRDLVEIAGVSFQELMGAEVRYNEAVPMVPCLAYHNIVETINQLRPAVDEGTKDGEFSIQITGCMSLDQEGSGLSVSDYCPTCEADCAGLLKAMQRLRAVRLRLNAVKDAMLPYSRSQFNNRQSYAYNRFKNGKAKIEDAYRLLVTYIETVNMLNFAVFMRNKATTSGSLREDPTGFTVQMVRAVPGIKDEVIKLQASLFIEPDDVYNAEKTSLLVIEENAKLEITYQDGTQVSNKLEVKHDSALEKTLESSELQLNKSKSALLRLSVSVVPFIYIKAKDTLGADVGFEGITAGTQVPTDNTEDSRFIYKNKDLKVGLDIPEQVEQLKEATIADYNEAKLYPTQNIEGTDRWKFTCTWLLKTEKGELKKAEKFYFEVSKVKQPVYDLVNDSTWITKIEAK